MNLIKKFKDGPYLFPVCYVVTHFISNCVYFIIINSQLPLSDWFVDEGSPLFRLVWFSDTQWPNFAGIFIAFSFFYFKKLRKLLTFYLLTLYIEQFILKFDIGECFSGVSVVRAFYLFFQSKLYFSDGRDLTAIHFSLLMALVHIAVIKKSEEGKRVI